MSRKLRNTSQKKSKKDINYKKAFYSLGLIIIMISIIYFIVVLFLYKDSPPSVGEFGDLFGGLNTLFSGLAFAGVIITVYMQMEELKLTRVVMEESLIEQKDSREAFQNQLESMNVANTLETLKYYANIPGVGKNKVLISNQIIKYLTNSILCDKKYKNALEPEFILNHYLTIDKTIFEIKNIGIDTIVSTYEVCLNKEHNSDSIVGVSYKHKFENNLEELTAFKFSNDDILKIDISRILMVKDDNLELKLLVDVAETIYQWKVIFVFIMGLEKLEYQSTDYILQEGVIN